MMATNISQFCTLKDFNPEYHENDPSATKQEQSKSK